VAAATLRMVPACAGGVSAGGCSTGGASSSFSSSTGSTGGVTSSGGVSLNRVLRDSNLAVASSAAVTFAACAASMASISSARAARASTCSVTVGSTVGSMSANALRFSMARAAISSMERFSYTMHS
jgi:hypothetical protein